MELRECSPLSSQCFIPSGDGIPGDWEHGVKGSLEQLLHPERKGHVSKRKHLLRATYQHLLGSWMTSCHFYWEAEVAQKPAVSITWNQLIASGLVSIAKSKYIYSPTFTLLSEATPAIQYTWKYHGLPNIKSHSNIQSQPKPSSFRLKIVPV